MNDTAFLSCGNIMSDVVERDDGSLSELQIGGPALYALSGIRLFTRECRLVCQAGADYAESYGVWLDNNGITRQSVRVAAQYTTQHLIHHQSDGSYTWRSRFGTQLLGYLKTTPAHIGEACGAATRGVYLAQNTDAVFWQALARIKKEKGFRLMWELEVPRPEDGISEDKLQRVLRILPEVDIWSLNSTEAGYLFDLDKDREIEIIRRLQELPVPLTFFRVGKKGAYLVAPDQAYFCPAITVERCVDPLGCGNCSTGAMLYGIVSGMEPERALAAANVAAGFNAAQYGPVPLVTQAVMEQALILTDRAAQAVQRL